MGLALEQNGQADLALATYARMTSLWPKEIAPYHRLSVLALRDKDAAHALVWIDKALEVDRGLVELWNNRGLALTELGRYDEAKRAFDEAIAIREENWDAYYNLGRMLFLQKRFEEAEPVLRRAAELDQRSAMTFNNLGLVYHQLHRYDDEASAFDRAIEIDPTYIEARSNKGASLFLSRRFRDAESQWRETLRDAPEEAGVHYNLASLLLCQGNLADGFREYEWRWKTKGWVPMRTYHGRPLWDGDAAGGETILVWHEQGFGDTIQFVRFVQELSRQNVEIVLEVQAELYRLLAASFSLPNVRIIRGGTNPPTFDYHIPLLSLPSILGIQYETFPAFKPYVRPRGWEVDEWRMKLKKMTPVEHRKKKKIGIAWAGNPSHPADHNRSMSWNTFAPIVESYKDRFQFFDLQPTSSSGPADNMIVLGDQLKDFGVTAAIMANLDLVISVDTSIVHLAGALGRRVWNLLSYTPDWRWKIGDERTPWYPSMTLFWQQSPSSWDNVISEVIETLSLE